MDQVWVLLLRGVNVGANIRLPMAGFRAMLGGLGLGSVQTYLQSGNAVFRSDLAAEALDSLISAAIAAQFGFRPALFLRTLSQVEAVLAANPYPLGEDDPKTRHIFFLAEPAPDTDLAALQALAQTEAFTLTDAAFYLFAPGGIGRSVLVQKLPRYLKVPHTARNLRSINAVADLARTLDKPC